MISHFDEDELSFPKKEQITLIHDTRDQDGKHAILENYLRCGGYRVVRSKMYVGDIALLKDQSVCVDLKRDLQEVYGNLVGIEHTRFRNECIRAKESGVRLIILVELSEQFSEIIKSVQDVHKWVNERYEAYINLRNAHEQGKFLSKKLPTSMPVSPMRMQTMMETMSERYDVEWEFCNHLRVGQTVEKLLGLEVTNENFMG